MAPRVIGRHVATGSWVVSLPMCDPPDGAELSITRDIGRLVLHDYPDAVVLDALLVLDVLITDAVRGGPTLHEVRLRGEGPYLGLAVTSVPAAAPQGPATASDGLGRLMLEELTRSWGVEHGDDRHAVWAELAGGWAHRPSPRLDRGPARSPGRTG